MHALSPLDCRVLGVLVEKAMTVAAQYPLSLHAVTAGCNQKNNRDPVMTVEEDDVLSALDRLRAAGFVRELMPVGSRVVKYRHLMREALEISLPEMVVLTELLLRGPQTTGELRGRASRMHALDSLETVENVLEALAKRPSPLAMRVAPAPGSRAARYAQLLCPGLHAVEPAPAPAPAARQSPGSEWDRPAPVSGIPASPGSTVTSAAAPGSASRGSAHASGMSPDTAAELRARLDALEARVDALSRMMQAEPE